MSPQALNRAPLRASIRLRQVCATCRVLCTPYTTPYATCHVQTTGTYLRRACARQTLHARGEALAGAVSRHRALLAADPLFGPPPPLSATGVVPSDWVPRLQLAALGLPEEVLARARARGRAGAAIAGCMPGAGYVGKAAVVSHVVRGSVGSVPTSTSTASSSDDNGVVSSSRSSSSRSSSSGHPFKASPGSLEGLVGLSEDAEAEAAVLKMLGRWRGPPEGEAGRRAAEAQVGGCCDGLCILGAVRNTLLLRPWDNGALGIS